MKIRYKLFILFFLLGVVPLAVVGYISYSNAKEAIFEQQKASLQSIVESRVFDVELLIKLRKEQARLISGNYLPRQLQPDGDLPSGIQSSIQAHIQSTLFALQGEAAEHDTLDTQTRSFIERIELSDLNGQILASTDNERTGQFFDERWLNRLPENGSFFAGYLFDDHTGQYYLTIISSVTHYNSGELSGAIILSVHPGILQQIAGHQPGLQNTGEVFITEFGEHPGRGTRIIAGLRDESVTGHAIAVDVSEFENSDFFERTGREGLMTDHHGNEVLAISRELPEMNWAVIGKIDAEEIFEPVNVFRNQIILAVLLMSFLSLVIAYTVSSSAAGLMDKLVQTFSKLSKGKLAASLSINREDEFGELARSANQTSDYLKKKVESANQIASGRYGERVHSAGDEDQLGSALQVMTDNLEHNRKEISVLLDQLRAANAELSENQARLQSLFETSSDAIITIEKSGRMEETNEAAEQMFGYSKKEITGLFVGDILPSLGRAVEQLFESGARSDIDSVSRAGIGVRKDGSTFPVSCSCSLVEWNNHKIAAAIVRDLTYQRKLERNMMEAGLKERSKIGHEIHEGLGQTLTGLQFITGNIAGRLAKENHPAADEVREIADSIRQADQHAQQLFHELVVVDKAQGGLVRSLKLFAELTKDKTGTHVVVEAGERFICEDNAVAIHLFHIIQDGVEQAVEQQNPDQIKIKCMRNENRFSLSLRYRIVNKGEQLTPGITDLMKYRMNLMGGAITSEFSEEKEWFEVRCEIPAALMEESG